MDYNIFFNSYFNKERKEMAINYLNDRFSHKLLYLGRGLDIANAFIDYFNSDYTNEYRKCNELYKALWTKNTKHIKDIFSGREYGALKLILSDKYAETFKEIWDRATLYIYSSDYYRRSYRSDKSSNLYMGKNIYKLRQFVYIASEGFTLDKYFKGNMSNYQGLSVIADIIAVELDRNNQEILGSIRGIIYNDNNAAILTREIVQGMFMSRNGEAHRMLGDLLLAAKLQEGLRQSIVESMDEGSKEGFIYLLKLIIDNNLSRFSSIVRAFGTWTGLAIDVERPKLVNKCLNAVYDCLTNDDYLKECINSSDNLLIYIGIWATAFSEVEDIGSIIIALINATEKYKKLVALQFLSETQFTEYKHKIACQVLEEKDLEVLAWTIKNLFSDVNMYRLKDELKGELENYYTDKNYKENVKLFNSLWAIVDMMPKKEMEFKESVFPWVNIKLSTSEVIDKMVCSVAMSYDNDIVDKLIDCRNKMNAGTRDLFVDLFLKKPGNIKQKNFLLECIGDRSASVRESAFKIVNGLKLKDEEYRMIEGFLQYKSGDLRKNAIKLLLKQPGEKIADTVNRLSASGDENMRLGAIDITSAIGSEDMHKDIYERCLKTVTSISGATQKEKMLTKGIMNDTKTFENGFGLYDKSREADIPRINSPKVFNIKSVFLMDNDEIYGILSRFSNLIHENRYFEYEMEIWDGTKEKIILGGSGYLRPFSPRGHTLSNYPIAEKIREFAETEGLTCSRLIQLDFSFKIFHRARYRSYLAWFDNLLNEVFDSRRINLLKDKAEELPYIDIVKKYIELLLEECSKEEKFIIGRNVSQLLYSAIPPDKHCEKYTVNEVRYYGFHGKDCISDSAEVEYWLKLMKSNYLSDETFSEYFITAYNYYRANKYNDEASLYLEQFGHALELGIIDEDEVYKELMARPLSPGNMQNVTNSHWNEKNTCPKLKEIGLKAVSTIVEIEIKRGELNTEVTHLAAKIGRCYGADVFIIILLNMDKDTYVRGYNFLYGDLTKRQMLSHLLKCCYPKDGENAETLGNLLKGKKISPSQLIDGAMYAPQWLDIVSEYLGYEGLKSACWYFHAHVNEVFSDEKASIVARYSPISPQDFRDGAFDQQWFMDAYKTVGEKVFKLVYDSAKYIAAGGLHKRSQLFADATLGKLDVEEVIKRIVDKRNKDYLLTYGLIPIQSKEGLLSRYEYIHQFMKESKKFGAQRQASETRSANVALLNLARNAGYSDINRLSWNMEIAKMASIRQYLAPQKIEDIEVQLIVDELGQADISCIKDGKVLKDIPSKFKKHEYIQELKAINKSLKEQYSRARGSFEEAMEREDEFEAGELAHLCNSPVLAPIIKNLVFVSDSKLGYFHDCSLVDSNGEIHKLDNTAKLIIAHPAHLYESGDWLSYQRDIFIRRIVQPFKQVFRELYLPNADELSENTQSRRYAGYQVQPRKTLALLKTRGWMASHEEGLQKVYYKENIIGTIYALADWFSPSDIEAPTLEYVRFEDRKTFKPVPIDKVPKLIFSEVMRDVDLVVSVAHVGGVDPEASLSTIEIRKVIVEEILRLLKLENVLLKDNHAFIKGAYGEYTVHLGSGVVHKMAYGSVNILPVHSGHMGRIFLPFIDDDPKSSEIISKIVLLAEDKKIKDPSILSQITV